MSAASAAKQQREEAVCTLFAARERPVTYAEARDALGDEFPGTTERRGGEASARCRRRPIGATCVSRHAHVAMYGLRRARVCNNRKPFRFSDYLTGPHPHNYGYRKRSGRRST